MKSRQPQFYHPDLGQTRDGAFYRLLLTLLVACVIAPGAYAMIRALTSSTGRGAVETTPAVPPSPAQPQAQADAQKENRPQLNPAFSDSTSTVSSVQVSNRAGTGLNQSPAAGEPFEAAGEFGRVKAPGTPAPRLEFTGTPYLIPTLYKSEIAEAKREVHRRFDALLKSHAQLNAHRNTIHTVASAVTGNAKAAIEQYNAKLAAYNEQVTRLNLLGEQSRQELELARSLVNAADPRSVQAYNTKLQEYRVNASQLAQVAGELERNIDAERRTLDFALQNSDGVIKGKIGDFNRLVDEYNTEVGAINQAIQAYNEKLARYGIFSSRSTQYSGL